MIKISNEYEEEEDVLENLSAFSAGKNTGDFKEKVYLTAKKDFKLGKSREIEVVHGTPTRTFFKNKVIMCKSFDGLTGKKKTMEGWSKDPIDCLTCPYNKGISIDGGDKLKCQLQYAIQFKHEDPSKEYQVSLNQTGMNNLDNYNNELRKMGLRITQVVTSITREESEKYVGSEFKFAFVRETNLTMSELEKVKINSIIEGIKAGESDSLSVPRVADMLMMFKDLKDVGLTKDRALRLATAAANGNSMITEDTEFLK